ncbi:MAG TPA: hypothetical protein VIC59_12580 [Gemmatimonadota bacterium]|jgi:hypothetical protein
MTIRHRRHAPAVAALAWLAALVIGCASGGGGSDETRSGADTRAADTLYQTERMGPDTTPTPGGAYDTTGMDRARPDTTLTGDTTMSPGATR